MQKTILPLGLLDFSLAHVQSVKWGRHSRNLHQAVALAPSPAPSFESAEEKSVFSRRRGRRRAPGNSTIRDSGELISSPVFTSPMSELERRVLALQTTQVPLDDLRSQSLEATPESEAALFPRYTDEELLSMYEDLLETPLASTTCRGHESPLRKDRDTQAMIEVRQRVHVYMQDGDLASAESAIESVKLSGITPPEDIINMVLGHHALHGNIERFERFMADILTGKPSETQRDLHIKSYLRDPSVFVSRAFPTRAIDLLHKYEASGLHAPMKSYTRIVSSLFSSWDLFAHMRYVAHPTPDAYLYALMIRACTSAPLSPEPEHARRGNRAEPKGHTTQLEENGSMRPSVLLQLVVRIFKGSVGRVLGWLCWMAVSVWILAEAEMMQHMFHAYAAGATRIVDDGAVVAPAALPDQGLSDLPSVSTDVSSDSAVPTDLSHMDTVPSFSHLPPQSPGEVIAEARALFDRILHDTNPTSHSSSDMPPGPLAGKFNVTLTPRLLNAYMSRDVFERLFSSRGVGLMGDSRTYVDALEKCALARPREQLECQWIDGVAETTMTARLVERAHSAVRRAHLLSVFYFFNVYEIIMSTSAIALVRTFMTRYPPTALLPPARNPSSARVDAPSQDVMNKRKITLFAKPPILSTRTILSNPSATPRPLVRLTSAIGPPDERVPPLLMEQGRGKEVGFLKWACKAYEGALRTRREAVLGARVSVGEDVQ
ncbi:hypothetical protein F4604DRAFT_1801661 [Suillus subluteus]|nr:hypothetical protein F4604DRAFT_1801661 [Suillus subluteus]